VPHPSEALVIAHVLRFRFKEETSEEEFNTAMEAFRRTGQVPSVALSVVGPYAGNPADGFTHSAVYVLADLAALDRFMYEPVHRDADFIVHPHMAQMDAFDVTDDDEPDLGAKIMDIQQRRLAADPELAELLGIAADS
jgi:hypothetical protein